jgi:hypothetical protein
VASVSMDGLATKDQVDPIIHKGYLGELTDAYLPARTDRKDPQVSPLYADLKGLPPTLIQVRDAARGRHTLRRRSWYRRRGRDVGGLATHDSCVAPVERTSGTRPPGPRQRWNVHPRIPLRQGPDGSASPAEDVSEASVYRAT